IRDDLVTGVQTCALPICDGWLFLLRWFHFLAGITWIGLLYYFNFVQTPFFATADAPVRTGMIAGSLVGRALWWFRWGAMFTFIKIGRASCRERDEFSVAV